MKRLFLYCSILLSVIALGACDDSDSFSSSASNTLTFSTDTVKMDTLFSNVASSTYSFWVYNNSGDGIIVEQVRLQKGNQTGFRVNVDGEYLDNTLGSLVNDIKVRKDDSIRVFVELTAITTGEDTPQLIEDNLVFSLESGVTQYVCLQAYAWDAMLCDSVVIREDSVMSLTKPVVIYTGLTVDSGVTLTINAPTTLYFHDGAGIDVYGTLVVNRDNVGTDVVMRGDRMDHMFDYLPYDRVSGQWKGIRIHPSSWDNYISNADIHSSEYGITCDSVGYDSLKSKITLENVVIHNCKGAGFESFNSNVTLVNCQVSNTLGDCVGIYGGKALIIYCTFAQFYPFDADRGAALRFTNFVDDYDYPLYLMECYNTLVTGYDEDVIYGETNDSTVSFGYYFSNSVLRTEKPDTASLNSDLYNNIIWETSEDSIEGKDHFTLVDEDNLCYDFTLDSLSTAIDSAMVISAYPTDRKGTTRGDRPDIGCYEYVSPVTTEDPQ